MASVESNVSTVILREFLVAIDHAETNIDTLVNSFADKLGIYSDASTTTTKINASVLHALRELSPQGEPLMRIWPDPAAPKTMSRWKNRESIAIYLRIVRSFVDYSVQLADNLPIIEPFAARLLQEKRASMNKFLTWSDKPILEYETLRLLASLCSVSDATARECVRVMNLQSPIFQKLSARQIKACTKDVQVREAFVDFVLTLVKCTEKSVHRFLMRENGLLASLFRSMETDSDAVLLRITSSMCQYVLESAILDLRTKRAVFNSAAVRKLLALMKLEDNSAKEESSKADESSPIASRNGPKRACELLCCLFFGPDNLSEGLTRPYPIVYALKPVRAFSFIMEKTEKCSDNTEVLTPTAEETQTVNMIKQVVGLITFNDLQSSQHLWSFIRRLLGHYPSLLASCCQTWALSRQMEPKPTFQWFCSSCRIQALLMNPIKIPLGDIVDAKWMTLVLPFNCRNEVSRGIQHTHRLIVYNVLGFLQAAFSRLQNVVDRISSVYEEPGKIRESLAEELRLHLPSPEAVVSLLSRLSTEKSQADQLLYARGLSVFNYYLEWLHPYMKDVKVDLAKLLPFELLTSNRSEKFSASEALLVGELLLCLNRIDSCRLQFLFFDNHVKTTRFQQLLVFFATASNKTIASLARKALHRLLETTDAFGVLHRDEKIALWLTNLQLVSQHSHERALICAAFIDRILQSVGVDLFRYSNPSSKDSMSVEALSPSTSALVEGMKKLTKEELLMDELGTRILCKLLLKSATSMPLRSLLLDQGVSSSHGPNICDQRDRERKRRRHDKNSPKPQHQKQSGLLGHLSGFCTKARSSALESRDLFSRSCHLPAGITIELQQTSELEQLAALPSTPPSEASLDQFIQSSEPQVFPALLVIFRSSLELDAVQFGSFNRYAESIGQSEASHRFAPSDRFWSQLELPLLTRMLLFPNNKPSDRMRILQRLVKHSRVLFREAIDTCDQLLSWLEWNPIDPTETTYICIDVIVRLFTRAICQASSHQHALTLREIVVRFQEIQAQKHWQQSDSSIAQIWRAAWTVMLLLFSRLPDRCDMKSSSQLLIPSTQCVVPMTLLIVELYPNSVRWKWLSALLPGRNRIQLSSIARLVKVVLVRSLHATCPESQLESAQLLKGLVLEFSNVAPSRSSSSSLVMRHLVECLDLIVLLSKSFPEIRVSISPIVAAVMESQAFCMATTTKDEKWLKQLFQKLLLVFIFQHGNASMQACWDHYIRLESRWKQSKIRVVKALLDVFGYPADSKTRRYLRENVLSHCISTSLTQKDDISSLEFIKSCLDSLSSKPDIVNMLHVIGQRMHEYLVDVCAWMTKNEAICGHALRCFVYLNRWRHSHAASLPLFPAKNDVMYVLLIEMGWRCIPQNIQHVESVCLILDDLFAQSIISTKLPSQPEIASWNSRLRKSDSLLELRSAVSMYARSIRVHSVLNPATNQSFGIIVHHNHFTAYLRAEKEDNSLTLLQFLHATIPTNSTDTSIKKLFLALCEIYSMSLSSFDRLTRMLLLKIENLTKQKLRVFSTQAFFLENIYSDTEYIDSQAQALLILEDGSLITSTRSRITIANFPFNRSLDAQQDLHLTLCHWSRNVRESFGLKETQLDQVYDPAALFTALVEFLARSELPIASLIHHSLLALALRGLSSHDEAIRKHSFSIVACVHDALSADVDDTFLFGSKSARQVHVLLESLRITLESLHTNAGDTSALDCSIPIIPALISNFMQDALAVVQRPTHVLYPSVNQFLLSRPMELDDVPMFYTLFAFNAKRAASAANVMHQQQERSWLLHYLRCGGIQGDRDVAILLRRHVLSILMSSFQSWSLGNGESEKTQLSIVDILLQILQKSCVGAQYLIKKAALFQWLSAVIVHQSACSHELLEALLGLQLAALSIISRPEQCLDEAEMVIAHQAFQGMLSSFIALSHFDLKNANFGSATRKLARTIAKLLEHFPSVSSSMLTALVPILTTMLESLQAHPLHLRPIELGMAICSILQHIGGMECGLWTESLSQVKAGVDQLAVRWSNIILLMINTFLIDEISAGKNILRAKLKLAVDAFPQLQKCIRHSIQYNPAEDISLIAASLVVEVQGHQ
uniref:Uncharacterized protein AlNc14C9G1206 n=1 Tax=Albugo laibachii Nc14 TaxID=890382 RepID=F0W2F5_9STRA|nr:conserved hypothetical protein [Albugo laibachii Nc14]|eukprot:CCA15241.1 conserved hypothetical protein [Albugo laibachii Nc14]